MKSFSDYIQNKNIDAIISEIAHKIVEANVDPWDFLIDFYKDQPEIIVALEAHKEENINEIWGGLKRFFGGAKELAKGAGEGLYGAAKTFGGRMGEAGKTAKAMVMGPEAHYAKSIEALQGLFKVINKNKDVQAAIQSPDPKISTNYKNLVNDLQKILKHLDKQKQMVGKLTGSTATTAAATSATAATPKPKSIVQPQPQTQPFQPSGKILGPTGQPITASYGT